MLKFLKKIKQKGLEKIYIYKRGLNIYNDTTFSQTKELRNIEINKRPYRFDIINYLAQKNNSKEYLEIGVRNPEDNFNNIKIVNKYSVDPGAEFKDNPVDFKLTSDDFFEKLNSNQLTLKKDIKFDIIFIDGLHLAEQVDRDIKNSMEHLSDNGFIVLHDCNPPTEFHARESYYFYNSPAGGGWNGTTWKAFLKYRYNYYSCCIDSDWGVEIFSKKKYSCFNILNSDLTNEFYEYNSFKEKRNEFLNLISFNDLQDSLN